MADEPNTDAPPEGDANNDTDDDKKPTALPDDPAALRAEVEKLRKEAARYRTKAKELEPLAVKARELEDAGKSETEKLTTRLTETEQRAIAAEARALRLEVGADRGLSPAQARRLVGNTREELEADADELLAAFKAPTGNNDRPTERLRPGAVPDAEPVELNPRKLAEQVARF